MPNYITQIGGMKIAADKNTSGKNLLSVDDLEGAIDTALQEAKDSGDFNGKDGTSAGFGTVTATATSLEAGSTPTVTVLTSGDNTAKNFSFSFGIPKGDKGDSGGGSSGGDIGFAYYGTCSTTGTTTEKKVPIDDFDSSKLVTGVLVAVKMTYAHTGSSNATLNVSSTGAKTIYGSQTAYGVRSITTSNISSYQQPWKANAICLFMYDGSSWQWLNAPRERMLVSSGTLYLYN